MAVTMETSAILRRYLSSRSHLQDIITYDQFKKLFPLTISEIAVQQMYSKLCLQRQTTILGTVEREVENTFDLPTKYIVEKLSVSSALLNESSIDEFITRLTIVLRNCKLQNQALDNVISIKIEQIKALIDELNDLKFGKCSGDMSLKLQEVEKSFDKVNSYLDLER